MCAPRGSERPEAASCRGFCSQAVTFKGSLDSENPLFPFGPLPLTTFLLSLYDSGTEAVCDYILRYKINA